MKGEIFFSIGDIKLWDVSNIADVDVRYTMPLHVHISFFIQHFYKNTLRIWILAYFKGWSSLAV